MTKQPARKSKSVAKRTDSTAVEKDQQTLRAMRKILDSIMIQKEYTGGPAKKQKAIKTKIIAGRLPVDIINQIDTLGISRTFHIERALRLYLHVIEATSE